MRARPMVMVLPSSSVAAWYLMAFDVRAVGRAQIARDDAVGGQVNFQVLAGDAGIVDDDVAAGAAAPITVLLSVSR